MTVDPTDDCTFWHNEYLFKQRHPSTGSSGIGSLSFLRECEGGRSSSAVIARPITAGHWRTARCSTRALVARHSSETSREPSVFNLIGIALGVLASGVRISQRCPTPPRGAFKASLLKPLGDIPSTLRRCWTRRRLSLPVVLSWWRQRPQEGRGRRRQGGGVLLRWSRRSRLALLGLPGRERVPASW